MTTLFDATRPVKTTRKFGQGILASHPTYRTAFTASDLDWLREDDARRAELDAVVDEMFQEAEARRLVENGLSY